ncbi:Fe-S cluster assembly protein SufB [Candidatus Micrarchaeota archaeon]|nr:Fe-S cluster assembly protein SufB [Candidatus Micrarchaeota archaeon]
MAIELNSERGGGAALALGYKFLTRPGITERTVREISAAKGEPDWMLERRLKSFRIFQGKPIPTWGPDLSGLDLSAITYFASLKGGEHRDWKDVPAEIKLQFEKLGVPEAERKFLSGSGAMVESQWVYKSVRKELEDAGVIFMSTDDAVQQHPEIVKEYFMTKCVPPTDNKFAALHGAVWSGGAFVFIPEGVKVETPLQLYFLMNYRGYGQFEHTLLIAEPHSQVSYLEACSAPRYAESSLHSAVVEIFVKKRARVKYTSIQNWSDSVYNLNTKRSVVDECGFMEWVGGSLGAKVSMLYPCSILRGRGARADHIVISIAKDGTVKDGGAKVIHAAPGTTSNVVAKSICLGSGRAGYRGLLRVNKGCANCRASVRCDALLLDSRARSATFPVMEINENKVAIVHEATVGRISEDRLFYLMSRGLGENEAKALIVRGFVEPLLNALPLEYAVEFSRYIEMEIEGPGAVG